MPTVVFKSTDSFNSKEAIWSGISMPSGTRLHADVNYVYLATWRLYRNTVSGGGSGIGISPDLSTNQLNNNMRVSNFLGDFGISYATTSIVNFFDENKMDIYTSYYPESEESWALASGVNNEQSVDIIFPDIPESPRFLIGLSGDSTQKVLIATAGGPLTQLIQSIYPTNWTAMVSGAMVTDLEAVRLI